MRAALEREGGRRRDGSAPCREGRNGQAHEKEMSQPQWLRGRGFRKEEEGQILGQKDNDTGRPAHRRWLSPIPIVKLGLVQNLIVVASLQDGPHHSSIDIFIPL